MLEPMEPIEVQQNLKLMNSISKDKPDLKLDISVTQYPHYQRLVYLPHASVQESRSEMGID